MISHQALQQQRRKRQIARLSILMEQEISRILHDEQSLALRAVQDLVVQAVEAMRYDVYDVTLEQCDTIETAFQELLCVVRESLSAFTGSDLTAEMRPYPLIVKLAVLHRVLIDAQRIVSNVRGQCRSGRLATDPTGSYWHLRASVRAVVQDYQSLLGLLTQEDSVSQRYPSATA